MTSRLSIPNRCFDIPAVRVAPLTQADRDAGMLGMWQGNRHLPTADRDALLTRYSAQPSIDGGVR